MDAQQRIWVNSEITKWGLVYPDLYCPNEATGVVQYDPGEGTKHFDPWWVLIRTDDQIVDYYAWFLKRYGKPVYLSRHWGAHISAVKHEEPSDKTMWGKSCPDLCFRYSSNVRWDNEKHAWLDVYSPQLSEFRVSMGLPPKEWYHLTIGRMM